MATILAKHLLEQLIKMKAEDGYPTIEFDGEVLYRVPENQKWTYDGYEVESIVVQYPNRDESEWTMWFNCGKIEVGFGSQVEVDLNKLKRYEIKFLPFTEYVAKRYIINVNRKFTEDELWEWTEQQEIETIEDISFDEENGQVIVVPFWDDALTKEHLGRQWANDFHRYFATR